MNSLLKNTAALGIVVSLLTAPIALADTVIIGNDSNSRTQVDGASNFTVIDTNHMATGSGQISSFGYYASNLNPFRFVIVNNGNVVQYVSPQITPSGLGVNTYTASSPVPVQAGYQLGIYFPSAGAIPFVFSGSSAMWTASGSGLPTVGMTLMTSGSSARTYSVVGYGTMTPSPTPTPTPTPSPSPSPSPAPILSSVDVTPPVLNLMTGATHQLVVHPKNQFNAPFSGASINYSSSNPSVTTVSSTGLVTGVSSGFATITATATSGSVSVTDSSFVNVNPNLNGLPLALRIQLQILLNQLNALMNQLNNLINRLNATQ